MAGRGGEPERFFGGIDGNSCPAPPTLTQFCGEDSKYSLYVNATAWTARTNRTNQDTDADGLTDLMEVRGLPVRITKTGGLAQSNWSVSDPTRNDTDADGLLDQLEVFLGSNATSNDTDTYENPVG